MSPGELGVGAYSRSLYQTLAVTDMGATVTFGTEFEAAVVDVPLTYEKKQGAKSTEEVMGEEIEKLKKMF